MVYSIFCHYKDMQKLQNAQENRKFTERRYVFSELYAIGEIEWFPLHIARVNQLKLRPLLRLLETFTRTKKIKLKKKKKGKQYGDNLR